MYSCHHSTSSRIPFNRQFSEGGSCDDLFLSSEDHIYYSSYGLTHGDDCSIPCRIRTGKDRQQCAGWLIFKSANFEIMARNEYFINATYGDNVSTRMNMKTDAEFYSRATDGFLPKYLA